MNRVDLGPASDWLERACRTSPMGVLVRDFDWDGTSLGPPSGWPAGLRAAVEVCLASRFPMLVVWGPELIKIYNDGYRPMLGTEKHPMALGSPASTVWREIWDTVGPLFDSVMTSAEPTWDEDQLLMIERNGYPEECYFTYSYSPLFDDDGSVGGVLDVAQETTDRVVAERRLGCIAELTAELVAAEHTADVYRLSAAVLGRWRSDVLAVDLHQVADGTVSLVASNRRPGVPGAEPELLLDVLRTREASVVGGNGETSVPAELYVAPIGGGFGSVEAVLSTNVSPHRPFDEGYRGFLDLVGQVIGTALDSAYRRSVTVGEQRRLSEVLEVALLQPASDFSTVAARYLPADGSLAIGGDWYDIIDLGNERRGIVVGDCVGHGLEAAAVMSQLRSACRAMLLDRHDPAAALMALDGLAATFDGAMGATAVCAVIDRRKGLITYSRAGHPPPLVLTGDLITWLDGGGGVPLAVGRGVSRTNDTFALAPESTLLVYTDGLIERRGESLDVGFQRLADCALALAGASSVQGIADGLLQLLLLDDVPDDVVLVVKQLLRHEPEGATAR